MIYQHGNDPDEAIVYNRTFVTAGIDENGLPNTITRDFVFDTIDDEGSSTLFPGTDPGFGTLVQGPLEGVTKAIVFAPESSYGLQYFAEQIATNPDSSPVFIQVDITGRLRYKDDFAAWLPMIMSKSHGYNNEAFEIFNQWFAAISRLPIHAHILLVFPCIWRNFCLLRYLSVHHGLPQRPISFLFVKGDFELLPQHEHFITLTKASITNTAQVHEYTSADKIRLVNHGCRGFNPMDPTELQ
jgi:hypothetical protein